MPVALVRLRASASRHRRKARRTLWLTGRCSLHRRLVAPCCSSPHAAVPCTSSRLRRHSFCGTQRSGHGCSRCARRGCGCCCLSWLAAQKRQLAAGDSSTIRRPQRRGRSSSYLSSGQPTLFALTLGHPIRKQHRRKTAPSENGREATAITCCKDLNNSPVAAASHCQMAGIAVGTRQCLCHRCRCRSAAIQRFLNGGRDGLDLCAQLLLNAIPASMDPCKCLKETRRCVCNAILHAALQKCRTSAGRLQ
jgi:hypothetical protein